MPLYEWICPQCQKLTSTIRPVSEYNIPPEKCEPESERTEEKNEKGEPIYIRNPSCGYDKQEVISEDGTNPGWKKVIGSTRFILRGFGWARDGYQ